VARGRRLWEPELLRAAREALRMTLREAAERMIELARDRKVPEPGVTAQAIFRHEHGSFPGPDYRRLYCLLYQKSECDLGFRPPHTGATTRRPDSSSPRLAEDNDDVLRRDFLRHSTAALTLTALPGLGVSVDGGEVRPRLSARNVDELESVTDAQRRLYQTLPSGTLWSAVDGHLRLRVALTQDSQPERVHRRVAALGGEAAGLLAWLAFDLGNERAREGLYDLALSLTAESGDAALDAYVRAFRSQVRQTEGRPREALTLASQAAATTGAGRIGRVPAWLRTRHALALAEVRDEKACLIVLAKAEEALGHGGHGSDPAWMYAFDHERLTAARGDCMLRLDQPESAERAYREALDDLGEGSTRHRAELLTGIASAVLRQRRIDEACALARESLDVLGDQSPLGVARVRRLRRDLDDWHTDPGVVALDERLAVA
jgi:tetratricopeptide (TPR) repeat protein